MEGVLLPLASIAAAGVVLRVAARDGAAPEQLLGVLCRVAFHVLLPALFFRALYRLDLGGDLMQAPLAAGAGVGSGLLLGGFALGFFRIERPLKGALILACGFGGVTLLGRPLAAELAPGAPARVLLLGELTVTALNLTVGAVLAEWFASGAGGSLGLLRSLGAIFKMTPLWALAAGAALNAYGAAVPAWVLEGARLLGEAAPAVLLLALGIALPLPRSRHLALVPFVAAVKLFAVPAGVWLAGRWCEAGGSGLEGLVLQGALPTQLLTFVIAERCRLDTGVLAAAIAANWALAFVTLPLVHGALF